MKKAKSKTVVDGKIVECSVPTTNFCVELDNGSIVLTYLVGRTIKHYLQLEVGDRVRVELSTVDPTRGKIIRVYRKI